MSQDDDRATAAGIPRKNALTIAIGAALTGQTTANAQQTEESPAVGEIIVTAQKREENLQDLPFSIQAISEDDMVRQGLYKFEDYVRFLPSVSYVTLTPGSSSIVFRGLAASAGGSITDSSVALYLDEQPLTQFNIQVDPRLVDIQRIEALAGPQGTLYGDSSQSGTLRIITNKPDASAFDSFVDVTGRTGEDSSGSYDVSGMVNIPLIEDKLAIRLVGFSAVDGGFIDNVAGNSPTLGASTPARGFKTNASATGSDINDVEFSGGRIAARWTPDDTWSVTLAGIYQETNSDSNNDYDPAVGDMQTVKFFLEPRDDKWWQTALTVEKTFGNLKFLSATSYFDRKIDYTIDRTDYAAYFNYGFCPSSPTYCWSGISNGTYTLLPGGGGLEPVATADDQDTTAYNTFEQWNKRFTQEFRLSGDASRYHWVAGLFYETKSQEWFYRAYTPEFSSTLANFCWSTADCGNPYYAANTPNPAGDPAWWFSHDDVEWDQWAVFGDITFNLTDQWILSVGARYFDQESERVYEVDKTFITSPVWPDFAPDTGKRKSDDSDWVPKISLTYKINEDSLVYALYSEGFRAGGVNRSRGDISRLVFPQEYKPDYLKNHELGTKNLFLDGRLQVNATAFLMKWDDFQIEVVDPSFRPGEPDCTDADPPDALCNNGFQVIVGNVGKAEVKGVEFSLKTVVGEGLDLGLDATWLDSEVSEDVLVTIPVPEGSELPLAPEWKLATYAQYNWPVGFVTNGSMYARAQYTYTDDSLNQLEPFAEVPPGDSGTDGNNPQRTMDAYGVTDFSVGLQANAWELQAFVNNAFDERAELYWNTDDHSTFWGHNQLSTNRPREYGMRFVYRWGISAQ
jgi:outer membrane receptor protein involved in Fe transport